MKFTFRFAMILTLCLALTACGGEKNAEHEYILQLLENKDYDMAISVIENMRLREFGISPTEAEAVPAETTAPVETTVPPASTQVQLVYDTVNCFMEEKGKDLMQTFEAVTAGRARIPSVRHAMEYRLGNCDGKGNVSHCLLVWLDMDVAWDQFINDNVQLLLDLDTQKLYNSTELDEALIMACNGMPTNEEEFNQIAMNAYHSFVDSGNTFLMADSDICEVLSGSDLAAINELLNQN